MKAKFFKASELRAITHGERLSSVQAADVSVASTITEEVRLAPGKTFDAYLAYSSIDWQVIYGLYRKLKSQGISVYLDRIEDPQLHPGNVSRETAKILRSRMHQCRSLLFATTENYSSSKWMPWEVGYFDGFRGKVAIVPVKEDGEFIGQEYLGLYPVMESDTWLREPSADGTLISRFSSWVTA